MRFLSYPFVIISLIAVFITDLKMSFQPFSWNETDTVVGDLSNSRWNGWKLILRDVINNLIRQMMTKKKAMKSHSGMWGIWLDELSWSPTNSLIDGFLRGWSHQWQCMQFIASACMFPESCQQMNIYAHSTYTSHDHEMHVFSSEILDISGSVWFCSTLALGAAFPEIKNQ